MENGVFRTTIEESRKNIRGIEAVSPRIFPECLHRKLPSMHIQQTIQTVFDLIDQAQKMVEFTRNAETIVDATVQDQIVAQSSDLSHATQACLAAMTGHTVVVPAMVATTDEPAPPALASPSFDPTPQPTKRRGRGKTNIAAEAMAKETPAAPIKLRKSRKPVAEPVAVEAAPLAPEPKPEPAPKQVRRRAKPLAIATLFDTPALPVAPAVKPGRRATPTRSIGAAAKALPLPSLGANAEALHQPAIRTKGRKAAMPAPVVEASTKVKAKQTRRARA